MKGQNGICIIDDDDISIFGLKRAMASIDCSSEPSVFQNGFDALESFKKLINEGSVLPSLIFIDLNMPVMDGWDFIEELTKALPSPKDKPELYIMTSSIDNKDVEKAKIYGLEANYLIKPVFVEVLKGILG